MKMTLTTWDIADALRKDDNANWSFAGARALAEYLESLEEDIGEELELDVVAIRCDYSEYENLQAWAKDYFGNFMSSLDIDGDAAEDEIDEAIRTHIQDHGQLIEFDGGIIVSSF